MRRLPRLFHTVLDRLAPLRRARSIPGIPGLVAPGDLMLYDASEESIENYNRASTSAIDNLAHALSRVDRDFGDVEAALDFGCGHGRVMRRLVEHIPAQRITACDIDPVAVRFCHAAFGARPLVSRAVLDEVRFATYDLVWSGSLLTHLPAEAGADFLATLGRLLRPGGVACFSLHGPFCWENLEHLYGGAWAHEAESVRAEIAAEGIAYRPYTERHPGYAANEDYGMTWHDRRWIEATLTERAPMLEVLDVVDRGWDRHHDVYVLGRMP